MENKCKNCKYWDEVTDSFLINDDNERRLSEIGGVCRNKEAMRRCLGDYDLRCRLVTENFGCIYFVEKNK